MQISNIIKNNSCLNASKDAIKEVATSIDGLSSVVEYKEIANQEE